jgi:hypothetical protein
LFRFFGWLGSRVILALEVTPYGDCEIDAVWYSQ